MSISVFTNKIHSILDFIKLREDKVLTNKSISSLENFINGYMIFGAWGFYDYDLIYEPGDVDLNEFRYWIQEKPYIELSPGPSYSKFLLEKCNGDEEKAFDMFFELLDKFKSVQRHSQNPADE